MHPTKTIRAVLKSNSISEGGLGSIFTLLFPVLVWEPGRFPHSKWYISACHLSRVHRSSGCKILGDALYDLLPQAVLRGHLTAPAPAIRTLCLSSDAEQLSIAETTMMWCFTALHLPS
jgi:hypothetical protein